MQPESMRAPEVWTEWGCHHVSDVFSVGSTVLSWLLPGILGPHDTKPPVLPQGWSIAKLIKLLETEKEQMIDPPAYADDSTKSMYQLGRDIPSQNDDGTTNSMHLPTQPLADILLNLDTTAQVKKLFPILLAPNFRNRLPAAEVMKTQEYAQLQRPVLSSRLFMQ